MATCSAGAHMQSDVSSHTESDQTLTLPQPYQDQVETVVPREAGARVLVVAGAHRGQRARLLSRSGAAGVAAVQLAAELDVMRLAFDEISQFVGEAGDDE